MELEEAAQQLLGAVDEVDSDSKLDEAIDQAGAFTDARLTQLIAEQARDAFCKQVAAELEEQPDGRLTEQAGDEAGAAAYFYRNTTDLPGVLMRASTDAQ